jgi:GNAT superfamily N-acetyltransferase
MGRASVRDDRVMGLLSRVAKEGARRVLSQTGSAGERAALDGIDVALMSADRALFPSMRQVAALKDGRKVGTIDFFERPEGLQVSHAFVEKPYRGTGVGAALYDKLLAEADARKTSLMSDVYVSAPARKMWQRYANHGRRVIQQKNTPAQSVYAESRKAVRGPLYVVPPADDQRRWIEQLRDHDPLAGTFQGFVEEHPKVVGGGAALGVTGVGIGGYGLMKKAQRS